MNSDLSCSGAGSGIKLAAGVGLDCAGHIIAADANAFGEGPGITMNRGSTVRNCIVRNWDTGIYILGNANKVLASVVQDNISNGRSDFGDGISLVNASNNQLLDNTVDNNGVYDGIGLVAKSSNNLIKNNRITNNTNPVRTRKGVPIVNFDYGIRIEGPGAQDNQVLDNTISNSGLEGVGVFGSSGTGMNNANNVISGNFVSKNGFNGITRPGSGIRTFRGARNTTITNNRSFDNAANGIEVDSLANTITRNLTGGNGNFDLLDTNPGCDNNAWHNNTYVTAQPLCTTAP